MQICYNCGKEVDDTVLICPDCGALVKRYGAPVRESEEPLSPVAEPVPEAQPDVRSLVFCDESGKLRLRGILKVLCIVCTVVDFYLAFSQLLVLWLSTSGDFFATLLSEYASVGMDSSILEMMRVTVDFVSQNRTFVLIFGLLFLVKALCFIWFQLSKRRLSLYVAGLSAAIQVAMFLFYGGGIASFEYCLDILAVMLLLLRRDWNTLPK